MKYDHHGDVPTTLVVALGLWAGTVATATHAEVFTRLPVDVFIALVLFIVTFSAVAVTVDVHLRGWLERHGSSVARLALAGFAGIAAATGAWFAAAPPIGNIASAPIAPILLFVVPVTVALAVAAIRVAGSRHFGSFSLPASKAPVSRRAAT